MATTPVSAAKPSGSGASNAVKATLDAIANGGMPERTPEFWDGMTQGRWTKAYKARGTAMKTSADAQPRILEVNRKLKAALMEATGWLSFDHIPQGQHFSETFDKSFEDLIPQLLANVEPLNRGYGPKTPPELPVTPSKDDPTYASTCIQTDDHESLDHTSTSAQTAHPSYASTSVQTEPPSYVSTGTQTEPVQITSGAPATDNNSPGEDAPQNASKLQEDLLAPGSSPSSAIDVDKAEEGRKDAMMACGRLYEDKLRQIDHLYATASDDNKTILSLARRILWTFKRKAMQDGAWDVFGHPLNADMPFGARSRNLFPGAWILSFLPSKIVPATFFRGLDNGCVTEDRGVAGWLYEFQIETMFEVLRPEVLDGDTYYLKREHTRLLTLEYLPELESLDINNLGDIKKLSGFEFMPQIPQSTKRIIFFVNPSGNHWFTVGMELAILSETGATVCTITTFNSIGTSKQWTNQLAKYCSLLALGDSPFSVAKQFFHGDHGDMPRQRGSEDCGLFALDTLLNLARGMNVSANTSLTGFQLREKYLEHFATLVTTASGVDISEELASGEDGNGGIRGEALERRTELLRKKTALLSVQH